MNRLDSKPVYGDNDKYIKTKINSYRDKANTNFQGKEIPNEYASYKCLSLIIFGPVIRINKRYHSQTFLEQCKHEIKKNKMENLINDDLDPSLFHESDNESDKEFDSKSDY